MNPRRLDRRGFFMVGIDSLWHIFTSVSELLAVKEIVPNNREAEFRALAFQVIESCLLAVTGFQSARLIIVIRITQHLQIRVDFALGQLDVILTIIVQRAGQRFHIIAIEIRLPLHIEIAYTCRSMKSQ